MNLILTNFGHRFISEQLKLFPEEIINKNQANYILLKVLKDKVISDQLTSNYDELIQSGYLEIVDKPEIDTVAFQYKTNPIENISRVIFEFTTECNFNCAHCRNGFIDRTTETNINKLKAVVDPFNLLNIKRYDFIGGEVTKYGSGWLDLANYINKDADKTITVYTNGWWLDNTDFDAAGKLYKNDVEYLSDLKRNGVTHILFSIDGPEEFHDKCRNHKGLFQKILSSFSRIKQLGINPRVSTILFGKLNNKTVGMLGMIAEQIYSFPQNTDLQTKINHLANDPTNHLSNFIDIGNGAHLKRNKYKIDDIQTESLHCKAFYRPAPGIRIMANGNLSVCPLLDAGEDFGNIHNQDIISLLNNFQNSFSYKIHSQKEIKNYLKYLDKRIFGGYYDHICSIRAILTILARNINLEKPVTSGSLFNSNKKIADYTGFSEGFHKK